MINGGKKDGGVFVLRLSTHKKKFDNYKHLSEGD